MHTQEKWTCPKCRRHIHSRRERHVEICDGLGPGAHRRKRGPGQGWNKGKTLAEIYGDERSEEIRAKLRVRTDAKRLAQQAPSYREKCRLAAKKNGLGGPTKRGGRGKHGWYKGIWCDSSWELAWVLYHIDHGISFVRNDIGFEYTFNSKNRKYFPDFVLDDGTYVEVKGWITEEFKQKLLAFPHPIRVISRHEMAPFLEYVIMTYGPNFVELYQTKKQIDA